MYDRGSPIFGAQATSRTQSVWPSNVSSSIHAWVSSRKPHIFTRLSQPALAKRLTPCGVAGGGCWGLLVLVLLALVFEGAGVMSEPGRTAGAQETALQPIAWPLKISALHVLSAKIIMKGGGINRGERVRQMEKEKKNQTFERKHGEFPI
jgi:hypothetical protein